MSGAPSPVDFDPSPWIAANAALAARIGAGRARGFGLMGMVGALNVELLPERTITEDRDEERRRGLPRIAARGGRVGSAGSRPLSGIAGSSVGGAGASGLASANRSGADSVSTAALLARGYQPAVVKVISYAHGVTRATASAQYIERDDVELETHDGLRLPDRHAVAEEIRAWSSSFEKRQPSQDVVAVRVQLSGLQDTVEDRERLGAAVGAAFDGHRHAVRIDAQSSGYLEARVVLVMARTISSEEKAANRAVRTNGNIRPALQSRIRVVEQRMGTTDDAPMCKVLDARSEAAMKARIETATGYPQHGISIEPATPGHGRDALGQRLSTLVSKAPALDYLGKPIRGAEDIREITRDWDRYLRSQTPRDTMHMVVSAKAGTDVKAFANAVRAFLHQQFSEHKFMFGVHTDKAEVGHIHAHAIVAVRSESGTKLHPGPSDLAQWRVTYAAHAREHGLEVVATRAAEQASSRSYGPKDKSIVDVATTPRPERKERDRAYAEDPRNAGLINKARERMETARANLVRIPETERERNGVQESLDHWRSEAKANPESDLARSMVGRLTAAHEAGSVLNILKQAVAPDVQMPSPQSLNESAAPAMSHQPKSASKMLQDLRVLNKQVADVTALLPEGSRAKFIERAGTYLETIASRVDQRRAEEVRVEGEHKSGELHLAAHGTDKTELVADREIPNAQNIRKTARLVAPHASELILAGPQPSDPLEDIRRQQAEMLERLAKERQQAKEHDQGREAGE